MEALRTESKPAFFQNLGQWRIARGRDAKTGNVVRSNPDFPADPVRLIAVALRMAERSTDREDLRPLYGELADEIEGREFQALQTFYCVRKVGTELDPGGPLLRYARFERPAVIGEVLKNTKIEKQTGRLKKRLKELGWEIGVYTMARVK